MALKLDAVVFDLFGTLVPGFSKASYEPVIRRMAELLDVPTEQFHQVFNFDMWPDRLKGTYRDPLDSIQHACRAIGRDPSAQALQDALAFRMDYERSLLAPFPDVLPTLAALRGQGVRLGLISNCSLELVPLWDKTDIYAHVDASILSAAVHLAKPDPRIYALACERLQVSPQRCLYVGDGSDQELTGAREVGMHPVLVHAPLEDAYDRERADVEGWKGARISRIGEVLQLLDA